MRFLLPFVFILFLKVFNCDRYSRKNRHESYDSKQLHQMRYLHMDKRIALTVFER